MRRLRLPVLTLFVASVMSATAVPLSDVLALVERPDVERCLAAAVAAERRLAGVEPLTLDDRLTAGARAHAVEMARTGELAHSVPRTQYPGQWAELGENVGMNLDASTCTPMAERLAASEPHRRNTVDPKWRVLGVGAVESDGVLWAVVAFGQPVVAGPTPTTAATAAASLLPLTIPTSPPTTAVQCTCPRP